MEHGDRETFALSEAVRVLRLIAEQGGDIVEPWSSEMARRALSKIENEYDMSALDDSAA